MTDQAFMQQLALQHAEPVAVTSLAGSLMFTNPAFAALCDSHSAAALIGINVVVASGGRIAAAVLDTALKSDVQQRICWPSEHRVSQDFVCTVRCVKEDNVPLCLVLALHSTDALIADHRREISELESLCAASALINAFSWQLRLDEPAARIRWSPQAAAALSIGAASLPADLPAFLRLILPEDRISVQHAISGAIEQSSHYRVEYRLKSSDGSLHPMIGLGRVVSVASDGSRRLLALELDATRRGAVGHGGVFHERLLSAVLEGTDQPICVLDRQLRYSHFNAAYAALIAATQGVTVASGTPLLDSIQDVARRRRLGATLSRTLKGERLIETLEFEYLESGTRQWVDFSFSPLLSADGRVDGIVSCGQDVSAARHAEQRRRHFDEELQRRVKLQTDKFDTANRELSAVLATAVHAFDESVQRLGIALNGLQQASDEIASPQAESALHQTRFAVDAAAAVVRELPAIPLIATYELTLEQIDMNCLVRDCMQSVVAQSTDHHVEFDVATLPALRADQVLLRLVVRNLLVAALKLAAVAELARIRVHTAWLGKELVWIVSSGPRSTGSRSDCTEMQLQAAGTEPSGVMMLALARSAVQRLGGRLWAERAPDRSVAFLFVIGGE